MRSGGWIVAGLTTLMCIACVLLPVFGLLLAGGLGEHAAPASHGLTNTFLTSLAWSLLVAVSACVAGWLPGRMFGEWLRSRDRRAWLGAAVMIVPLCLPVYLVFWAWWQAWPPTSALYEWAVANQHIPLLRQITLWLGLTCWCWPLAAWCVAGQHAAAPAELEEMMRLDGVGFTQRWWMRLRYDARGLAIAALIVSLLVFNETTSFDLAEVFTFGNELRVIDTEGSAADVLAAGWPAMVVAGVGAAAIWRALRPVNRRTSQRAGIPPSRVRILIMLPWISTLSLPIALIAARWPRDGSMDSYWSLYRGALVDTLLLAAVCGVAAAVLALGLAILLMDSRRWVRILATVQCVAWLAATVCPTAILARSLETTYNTSWLSERVYQTSLILILGLLARLGAVSALLAAWIVGAETQIQRELRSMDGVAGLGAILKAGRPRYVAGLAAAGMIVAALSLGEVFITARLQPPVIDHIAQPLLNALHYQRPETIVLTTFFMLAAAVLAGLVAAAAIWRLRTVAVLVTLALSASGCGKLTNEARPLQTTDIFGAAGTSPGQYSYPRCLSIDPTRECLYIIDKSARVQRIGFDGQPQKVWTMPLFEFGKPTGVSVAPDGRVFVADTHCWRVMAFDSEGNELMKFGSYGFEPGQFIYPTDIAFGPEGRLYVSEYGGHDRVQVFDAQGKYLFEFGSQGTESGQFNRPQSLRFNADLSELFITDACNHRIVVTDPQGKVLRMFGSAGHELGQMSYPYGLTILDDGSLLVAEFGNSRLQRFDPQGASLGVMGSIGPGAGELKYPWAVDAAGDQTFVLDSGNHRVQVIRTPG